MSWSKNRAGLYIQDALADFHPDLKYSHASPVSQRKIYKNLLVSKFFPGMASGGAVATNGTSYLVGTTNDFLDCGTSTDFDLGSGVWTLETWIFQTSVGVLYEQRESGSEQWGWWTEGSLIRFGWDSAGAGGLTSGTSGISNSTWTHVAVTMNGSDRMDIWVDGVSVVNNTDTSTLPATNTGNLQIGDGVNGDFGGNFDEIRFSNGIVRYTADFSGSLQTTEWISDANTDLLIHCNETIDSGTTGSGATFTDSGNTGHTITETGDAIRDTTLFAIAE